MSTPKRNASKTTKQYRVREVTLLPIRTDYDSALDDYDTRVADRDNLLRHSSNYITREVIDETTVRYRHEDGRIVTISIVEK